MYVQKHHRSDFQVPNRRLRFLTGGFIAFVLAAAAAHSTARAEMPTSAVDTTGLAVTDTEVTVGQLHSATGTMAISETGSIGGSA